MLISQTGCWSLQGAVLVLYICGSSTKSSVKGSQGHLLFLIEALFPKIDILSSTGEKKQTNTAQRSCLIEQDSNKRKVRMRLKLKFTERCEAEWFYSNDLLSSLKKWKNMNEIPCFYLYCLNRESAWNTSNICLKTNSSHVFTVFLVFLNQHYLHYLAWTNHKLQNE